MHSIMNQNGRKWSKLAELFSLWNSEYSPGPTEPRLLIDYTSIGRHGSARQVVQQNARGIRMASGLSAEHEK